MAYPIENFGSAPFEIIDGDRGKAYPKRADFRPAGYCLFLSAANVTKEGFDFGSGQFIDEQKDAALRKGKLQQDDIVLTTRGTLGNVALYSYDVPFEHVRINSGMVILRCNQHEILPRFLYAFLRSVLFQIQVDRLRSGVAQPQLPIRDMKWIEFPFPTLSQQERLVELISAYDDLIENNRRRIALLEEAARLLYREWFVHFRFPGHEHVKITDGLPQGWQRVRMEKVLTTLESGGRPRGGASETGGVPSIGAENVTGLGQYDFSKEKYVPEDYFARMRRGVIQSRDVALYKDGAYIGRSSMFGDGFPHSQCAVNEHVFILRVNEDVGQNYLYFWICQPEVRQSVVNLNANTAQPGISQVKLKSLSFLLPPESLRQLFNESVESLVAQVFRLALMNRKLAQARDLLLPRLMNGEIAV